MKSVLVGSLFLALMATSAAALTIPYGTPGRAEKSHSFARKLYGYGWVLVQPDGKASAHALFSNSRKWRGSARVGLVVQVISNGQPLWVHRFDQTMSDPAFRGTIERHLATTFSLTPEQWASVTEIRYDFVTAPTKAECDFIKQKAQENSHLYYNPTATGCPA